MNIVPPCTPMSSFNISYNWQAAMLHALNVRGMFSRSKVTTIQHYKNTYIITIIILMLHMKSDDNYAKLDDGQSTEVQTHAGHSITWNASALCDPMTLAFWPKSLITCRMSKGYSLHQVWRLWDHLFLSYAAERHTHAQTDTDERYTPTTVVGVSNYAACWRRIKLKAEFTAAENHRPF